MPMLVRCRGVLATIQRAVVVSNSSASHRWLQSAAVRSATTSRASALVTQRLYSTSIQSYTAVAATTNADDTSEPAEPKRASRSDQKNSAELEKLLHGVSLSVQRTGRVIVNDIKLAERLIKTEVVCTSNQALLLLRCCGSVCVDEKPEDRTLIVQRIWNLLETKGVVLDESHYNALLRAHIENEHEFSPLEFLSWLENERGIVPNRVTYQHLIARFCNVGDIAGATTILEFMKQKDMTVNENVFHSLITGHCHNGDIESAENIMAIMAESGIDVGAESYLTLLVGMIRAGKSLEEVEAKMAEATAASNISFGDHEIFRLMVELVRAGNKEGAKKMSEALPRNRGFFQEMRNAIPQMIFAGDTELPFAILANFKTPALSDQTHADAGSRDHGLFFLRAMVKHEYPPEKVLDAFVKVNVTSDESVELVVARLLETCLELGKASYGRSLADKAKEKFGNNIIKSDAFHGHLRTYSRRITTKKEVVNLLVTMNTMGIPFNYTNVSNDLMPILFADVDQLEPAKVVANIVSELEKFNGRQGNNWSYLLNSAIQHLLNRENKEGLFAVARMVANIVIQPRPATWNASLARSYLATGELSWLVTVLYACSGHVQGVLRDKDLETDKDVDLFGCLSHIHSLAHRYKPDQTPDEVVFTVLKELKRVRLGFPEATANLLKPVMNESAHELIDDLVLLHRDRKIHLIKDRVESFLASARSKLKIEKSGGDDAPTSLPPNADLPSDVEGLEMLKKTLAGKGFSTLRVSSALVTAYAKNKDIDKIEALLKEYDQKGQTFNVPLTLVDDIVQGLINEKKLDEAVKFLQPESPTVIHAHVNKMFLSTYTALARALAEAGRHDDVITFLKKVDPKAVIGGTMVSNVTDPMDYYADVAKDPANVQAVFDVLNERGLITKTAHYSPLINVFLNKDDIEGAVARFEAFAKESRKLPQKFKLMERLIQLEDMERMQRVLDASISAIGEEKSLYDLATSFLFLGKTSQAKKLLQTPGLRYIPDKVNYICDFFIERGMISALENFVHLTQPVFACDREFLYSKLIGVYTDDSSKMTELWVRMQEEGYTPSDDLKLKMAKAFQKDGKPVPFQVPQNQTVERPKSSEPMLKAATEEKKANVETHKKADEKPKEKKQVKEKQEKTTEQLENERRIDEKLATFYSAVEAKDVRTAYEEFSAYVASGSYIPVVKALMAIEFFADHQAWDEGAKTALALANRGMEAKLMQRQVCVSKILENSTPEVVKEIADRLKPEQKRRFIYFRQHKTAAE